MKLPFGYKKADKRPEQEALESSGAPEELLPEASAPGNRPTSGPPFGAIAAFLRRGHLAARGPWSIWRVAAVAVFVYIAAANISYFLVLKPVTVRLETLREKKDIIQDFFIVRESSTAVAGFKDALMHGDQRMTVIAVLEEMAGDVGLRFSEEPNLLAGVTLSKRVTEYPIEISLKGSYHELGQFISVIESSERYLTVRSIEIDGSEKGTRDAEARIVVGAVSWEG